LADFVFPRRAVSGALHNFRVKREVALCSKLCERPRHHVQRFADQAGYVEGKAYCNGYGKNQHRNDRYKQHT
jgi:hypothetical protein